MARGVMTATLVAALAACAIPGVANASTARYVDCSSGNDAHAGTSSQPWRSLARANQASLAPGDSLLLRRGCSWTGPLKARWVGTAVSPITIGAYGSGPDPIIRDAPNDIEITGSHQQFLSIAVTASPPGHDAGCNDAPAGWRVGFRMFSGATYDTVRHAIGFGLYAGVRIDHGSSHNRILGSRWYDNKMKAASTTSDAGANALDIQGDDNEIAWNSISGSDQCSRWFGGRDGAAISIYGGKRNFIHHNRTYQNNTFLEIGNTASRDTVVAYNQDWSTLSIGTWLVVHSTGSSYGPTYGTKVYNNTAYLTGAKSYAIQCIGTSCSPAVLSMHDNIVWSNDRIGYAAAAFEDVDDIYWSANGTPKIYFPLGRGSRVVNPRFANPAKHDFRLQAGSPAIDRSDWKSFNLGCKIDLTGLVVPRGAAPDIGANER